MVALIITVIGIFVLSVIFSRMTDDFSETVAMESAEHMNELTTQLADSIDRKFDDSLNALRSLALSMEHMRFDSNQELLDYLNGYKEQWDAVDVFVYTEDGGSFNQSGEHRPVGEVMDFILSAKENGYAMSILKSDVSIVVPVEGDNTLEGKKIEAVSMCFSFQDILKNETLHSFSGEGRIYLAQANGAIISSNLPDTDSYVYNLYSRFEHTTYVSLGGKFSSLKEAVESNDSDTAIIYTDETRSGSDFLYVAISHVELADDKWTLFYTVPSSQVNRNTSVFGEKIARVGMGVMLFFAVLLVFIIILQVRQYTKSMERTLDLREKMLDKLVANTDYAFALLRSGGLPPAYTSPNLKTFFGTEMLTLVEREGKPALSLDENPLLIDLEQINAQLSQRKEKADFTSGHIRYSKGDETEHYFILQLFFHSSPDETLCIVQDVTEEHAKETALRAATQTAQQASAEKSRFLANMSHDIRTPMNAIINMAKFAQEEPDNAQEHIERIITSADHLKSLINDILDISRVESGMVVLNNVPADIRAETNGILAIIQPLCAAKKQTLLTEIDVRHEQVEADVQKMNQIVLNLLNNACKFTPEGGVIRYTIREVESSQKDCGAYEFSVSDTGIGIDERFLDKLFEPFSRAEDERVAKTEGTGLGLPIVKNLVDLMGGAISVKSKPEEGSTFTVNVSFRLAEKTEAAEVVTDNVDVSGLSILVADDDKVNQLIIGKLLDKFGVTGHFADDGQMTVNMFAAQPPGAYDAIFMDIMMPVMNGYAATQAIRELERPDAKDIPIIALSANVFPEDINKSLQAGMNEHLGKPADVAEIKKVLVRIKQNYYSAHGKAETPI